MLSIQYLVGAHDKVGFFQIFPYTGDLDNLETGTSVRTFTGKLHNGEYSNNFFKRKIKNNCSILVKGKIEVELDFKQGSNKITFLEINFKTTNPTFKQKYKQPTKKLLKFLKESHIVSFNYFTIKKGGKK